MFTIDNAAYGAPLPPDKSAVIAVSTVNDATNSTTPQSHMISYIPNAADEYWFQIIPECSLDTKDKYTKWLRPMTDSIHSAWSAHCRDEITVQQFGDFTAAANTWLTYFDAKYKDE